MPYPPLHEAAIRLKRAHERTVGDRWYTTEAFTQARHHMALGELGRTELEFRRAHRRCEATGIWRARARGEQVNQAAGRLIRSSGDYGALVLLDEAFSRNTAMLSSWCR